jgi:hypothetical protein
MLERKAIGRYNAEHRCPSGIQCCPKVFIHIPGSCGMNSPPIFSLAEAMPELATLLQQLSSRAQVLDDPRKAAIRAIWRAVDRTRLHLGAIREENPNARKPNPELVELWSDAAMSILDIDPQLSQRMREKAEYWSDPPWWRPRDAALDLSVDSVVRDAEALLPLANREVTPRAAPAPDQLDLFISHASEDKDSVAKPLADAVTARGFGVWLDRNELRVGDTLTQSINAALRKSDFGAVILSPAFLAKEWPRVELDALFSLEMAHGRKRILPVCHQIEPEEVAEHFPLLGGRLSVRTSLGMAAVASQIIDVLELHRRRQPGTVR